MKNKKIEDLEQQLGELTLDLQRTRADFENYRKRTESEKSMARASGRVGAISQVLQVIDTIERATEHIPDDLKDHPWVKGISSMNKQLDKMLKDLDITKIVAESGTPFNPDCHEAVRFDEAEGEKEVVAECLRTGYMLGEDVLRPSMVAVTKK